MRIISKQEIYTEAKFSLAGTCAVRLYHDGNISFSHQASDLLSFEENKYFEICENEKAEVFLTPNNVKGYKVNKRKDKFCFLCNSKPIVRYLSNRFKKEVSKGNHLEFSIKKSNHKIESQSCFKLELISSIL
jgi:hypothetical protein